MENMNFRIWNQLAGYMETSGEFMDQEDLQELQLCMDQLVNQFTEEETRLYLDRLQQWGCDWV